MCETGRSSQKHQEIQTNTRVCGRVLWEIETGVPYSMTKAHDVFSGLGEDASDPLTLSQTNASSAEEKKAGEEETEDDRRRQALQRATEIVSTRKPREQHREKAQFYH